jgi:hypothetical protein
LTVVTLLVVAVRGWGTKEEVSPGNGLR